MATENNEQLQKSRDALLLSLEAANKRLLEQAGQIRDMTLDLHEAKKELEVACKAIGELRSQVVYWKTRSMAVELLGPESVRQVENSVAQSPE